MGGSAFAAPVVDTPRVSGADRYETSANISASVFAAGSTANVIIASGASFPDGLAASALAGERNAPVLLVPATGPIPAAITAEIQRLGAANATIIGGVGAVGIDVRAELVALGLVTNRIGGADRYETAALVANAIRSIGTDDGVRTAFVATGEDFADALAASAPAYGGSHPVILTESSELSVAAAVALFDNSIQRVIILGGTGAVSAEVEAQIDDLGIATIRVAGADRYETAANLATRLAADADFAFDSTGVTLTTGERFPDALSGSALAAATGHPILFAEVGGSNATQAYIQINATSIATLNVLGGTGAVTATRVDQLETFATTSNQAFAVTPTGDARVLTGENQTFTVSGLTAATVDVALVACEAVTVSAQGVVTFADAETDSAGNIIGNDLADGVGTTLGVIDSIDGVAVSPATDHVNDVAVGADGSVIFDVDAAVDACVAAVVFVDADLDNQVNLDANNMPTGDFGVTSRRQFRVAPTVSATAQASVGDLDTFIFTFSENVTVASAAAFGVFSDSTCATAVTTGATATVDATGRVVVDTVAPAGAAGATVYLQAQASAVQDLDAVVNPASACLPVTLDVAPGATAAIQATVGDLDTFSFTFTEPVNVADFAAFDVFSDATCTTLVTQGASASGGGTATIAVNTAAAAGVAGDVRYLQAQAGAVTDTSGNANAQSACTAVTLDVAPTATAAIQTAVGDVDTFTVAFSEAVTVAAAASFDVFSDSTCTTLVTEGATTVGDGTASILVNTAAAGGAANSTVYLQAQAGAVTDATGNPNPAGGCTAIVLDVAPAATAAIQTTVGDLDTFTFAFSEPVTVAAVASFDVFSDSTCTTLLTDGATSAGSGTTSIVVNTAAAAGAAGATVYLQAQAGAVIDATGNPNPAGACAAVVLDVAPAATAAVQTTALDFDTFTFAFSEPVSVAAVGAFDVYSNSTCTTLVTEGATSAGNGTTSILVNTAAAAGIGGATVYLQAQAGAVTDATGNPNSTGGCTAVTLA